MNASADTVEQTDEEWRAEHFTEEQLAGHVIASRSASGREPNLTELLKAMEKYGVEGILDSAMHLPRHQYEKLETAVKEKGKRK